MNPSLRTKDENNSLIQTITGLIILARPADGVIIGGTAVLGMIVGLQRMPSSLQMSRRRRRKRALRIEGKISSVSVATVARRWTGNSPRSGDRSYGENTEVILPAILSVSQKGH